MTPRSIVPLALATLVGGACDNDAKPESTTNFELRTAALTLPGVTDACYDITVFNAPIASYNPLTNTVWNQPEICADNFGDNESAITYIGPCDASVAGGTNTVRLILNRLCQGGSCNSTGTTNIPTTEYRNPCEGPDGCRLERQCIPNGDTPVVFNLTIMRNAQQGFFDIAVNFEDIFCSAKFDCDVPLLFDPNAPNAGRLPSAIGALACTAGTSTNTHLYLTDVSITCDANTAGELTFDVPLGFINGTPIPFPGNTLTAGDELYPFLQIATYGGAEQLTDTGGASLGLLYFNYAFALDLDSFDANATDFEYPTNCTLNAVATASDGALTGAATPDATTYPVITYDVDLITNGTWGCSQHGLDDPLDLTDSVVTDYTPVTAPQSFVLSARKVGANVQLTSHQ